MTPFELILQYYSTGGFAELIFKLLGPTPIVVALIAFVGFIAYAAALPTSGSAFSSLNDPKLIGLQFVQLLFVVAFAFAFIIPVFNLKSLAVFVGFILGYVLIKWLGNKTYKENWVYSDFVSRDTGEKRHMAKFNETSEIKAGFLFGVSRRLRWPFWGPLLMLVSWFSLSVVIVYFDPRFPLIAWPFLIYEIATTLISSAMVAGVMRRYLVAPFVMVDRKEHDPEYGYVMLSSETHFILVTKEFPKGKIIYTSSFTELRDEINQDVLEEIRTNIRDGKGIL